MHDNIIFQKHFIGILLRCIENDQIFKILKEFHDGVFGGHFYPTKTTHKIISARYHQVTIFQKYNEYSRSCLEF